jgi:hypothetical protein
MTLQLIIYRINFTKTLGDALIALKNLDHISETIQIQNLEGVYILQLNPNLLNYLKTKH